jgi:hypothetical protein
MSPGRARSFRGEIFGPVVRRELLVQCRHGLAAVGRKGGSRYDVVSSLTIEAVGRALDPNAFVCFRVARTVSTP